MGVPKIAIAIGTLIALSLTIIFFSDHMLHPPCCDAADYKNLANSIDSAGVETWKQGLRTFLYPWTLSTLIRVGRLLNIPFTFLLIGLQLGCYLLAAIAIARVGSNRSPALAGLLYISLCCNVFIAPYLSLTLTDSLYTSLSLIAIALIMGADIRASKGFTTNFRSLLLMITVASMGVAIRPAAIWLPAIVLSCFVYLLARRKISFSDAVLAITLGLVPLLIQVIINAEQFKTLSPLPVVDLGTQQLVWGIENFKYATWVGKGAIRYFYHSGYSLPPELRSTPVSWYVEYPLLAISLLSHKLIAAFDFDFIMPYPNRIPTHPWLLASVSLLLLSLGLFGALMHLLTGKLSILGSRLSPTVTMMSWAAVNLITAMELRFALPALTYFIVVSAVLINHIFSARRVKLLISLVITELIVLPIFFHVAHFVRLQAPQIPAEVQIAPSRF